MGRSMGFVTEEVIGTAGCLSALDLAAAPGQVVITEASEQEIGQASSQVSPQGVLALVHIPGFEIDYGALSRETVLGFEAIRDPGNLGTIVRTADWFGIRHILCSADSVDLYNPKVVRSTMGAIFRVRVHYADIESFIDHPEISRKQVYGTLLKGENIYESKLDPGALILFGNEARGLSPALQSKLDRAVTIPSFSPEGRGSESLNLASSVAVLCSELRR